MEYPFYYSTEQQFFYDALYPGTMEANGVSVEDLVGITQEDYDAWFNPPEGKYGIWVDGHPVLADLPPVDYVALAGYNLKTLREKADYAITPLQDAVDIDEATDEEVALLKKWKAYRVALNRIDLSKGADIKWPTPPSDL